MPIRERSRFRRRRHWPYCQYCGTPQHPHGPYAYPPHQKLTPKEEKEDLKEYIEILKEELKDAEEQLKGPGKSKKK